MNDRPDYNLPSETPNAAAKQNLQMAQAETGTQPAVVPENAQQPAGGKSPAGVTPPPVQETKYPAVQANAPFAVENATNLDLKAAKLTLVPVAGQPVTLPPGTEIAAILVSGEDLIIREADGDLIIIKGGFKSVPSLVIGNFEIPANALVASLQANGISLPAAGDAAQAGAEGTPSSGGNFARGPGDIGDPFDIRDLLDFSERNRSTEKKELQEGFISEVNNPVGVIVPVMGDNGTSVDEDGLPEGHDGSGSPGTAAPTNSETSTTGTIAFTAPDGVSSIVINGVTINLANPVLTNPILGTFGEINITGVNLATGTVTYIYTLTENVNHADALPDFDTFTVTVTDPQGDVATGTFNVDIADDVPTANNDTDLVSNATNTAVGNVITGANTTNDPAGDDVLGADGADVSGVTSNGVPANVASFAAGAYTILGQYGTLVLNEDGGYTYTRTTTGPLSATDTFTYTLTDGDGDSDPATLVITIADAGTSITNLTPAADLGDSVVDEKGLPASSGSEGTGEAANVAADSDQSEINTGTFTIAAPDGLASITVNGTVISAAALLASGVTPVNVTTPAGNTLTITGYTAGTGEVSYRYTLLDNETHPNAGIDSIFDTMIVRVTDTDTDFVEGNLSIRIIDDVPVGKTVTATPVLDDDAQTLFAGNALGTDDVTDATVATGAAGSLFTVGADGVKSIAFTPPAGLKAIYNNAGKPAQETLTYATTTDGLGNTIYTATGAISLLTVFTLSVNISGAYTFTALKPLVHPTNSTTEENLGVQIGITITDGDDDTTGATLTVNVNDDTPTLGLAQTIQVNNSIDVLPADIGVGDLPVTTGADGATLTFANVSDPIGLTSGGLQVHYFVSGNVLYGYTGPVVVSVPALANQVFVLTLSGATNNYSFNLLQPLDGTVTTVSIGGSTAFGAGPAQGQVLTTAGGTAISVVSGWNIDGSFSLATWKSTGNPGTLTLNDVNGSTAGWGVDNNNFEANNGEFMRFDFDDADAFGGGYVAPPSFNGPSVSTTTFNFKGFNNESIDYVIHFSDGTIGSGQVAVGSNDFNAVINYTTTTPPGASAKFIDFVEFYAAPDSGPPISGKISLIDAGVTTTEVDVNLDFTVLLTDGDGDTRTTPLHIDVVDFNEAPSGTNKTISLVEDVSYTFTLADFGYSDPENQEIAGVVISTLPASGTLRLGNATFIATTFITAEQIRDGMLTYSPADNSLADSSFTFAVQDSGPGTGSNVNQDQSPNTMTLDMSATDFSDLTPVNTSDTITTAPLTGANVSYQEAGGTGDILSIDTAASGTTILNDLNFVRTDNNLEIGWSTAGGSRTVNLINQYTSPNQFEIFRLDEGGSFAGFNFGTGNYIFDDNLIGANASNDILSGTAASETLDGNNGNDLLFGNGGDDTLIGGGGSDLLAGGAGEDTLNLGSDAVRDHVYFDAAAFGGVDTINGFVIGVAATSDIIDLSELFTVGAGQSLSDFAKMSGEDLQVDVDGTGVASTFTTVATITGFVDDGINQVSILYNNNGADDTTGNIA